MLTVALLSLSGCRVGPDYQRPIVATPSEWRWKNSTESGGNAAAQLPAWSVFKDAKLDELEALAVSANQDVSLALARVDEARAMARLSRADFYPQVTAQPDFKRQEQSGNVYLPGISSFAGPKGAGAIPGFRNPYNDFLVPLAVSYEADVWGRVRRSVAAGRDRAEASVADYDAVRLMTAGEVAANYFALRSLDTQIDILQRTVKTRQESYDLIDQRLKAGNADDLDLSRASSELENAGVSLVAAKRQREQVVNALALLCGKIVSEFTIEPQLLTAEPPEIPADMPSALLERRPDVARGERLLAASCEDIGVAKAAYFPRLALTATGGFESQDLNHLFIPSSTLWNVAANLTQPVFTGGRNRAQLDAAKARYDEALSQYRQLTLTAFKDVEDALLDMRMLADQAKGIARSVNSARKVTQLSTARYEAGRISYFEVVDAQRQQLAIEQQAAQVLGDRMAATARLIKALGGGWSACVVDRPLAKEQACLSAAELISKDSQ
ncbi:MAG TPA: efflux transporter outer membrane subunit [Planctomycetota bacterium]|nr:efflux transporter outer membrane subunit [Planctomycetota bacterium]